MKKNHLSSVLVLLVFAVFGVSVLMVLLTGADVVKKLNDRDQSSYDHRTIVQYLTTRVHQADQRGMVSVREEEGTSVLVLSEEIEQVRYETLVYSYDGYLCELFTEADLGLELEFGEWILPIQEARFAQEDTHIRAELVMENGDKQSVILALRSGRGRADEE